MSDDFLLELKKFQELDQQVKEEIEKKISSTSKSSQMSQSSVYGNTGTTGNTFTTGTTGTIPRTAHNIIENMNVNTVQEDSLYYSTRISNLLDTLSKSIDNLERINRSDLYNKNSSVDNIVKRASLIDEIKTNYRKLKNYYEGTLITNRSVNINLNNEFFYFDRLKKEKAE